MSTNWSEVLLFIFVVAQFFCVTASHHVRLADDVRVLARRCRSRPPAAGAGSRSAASRSSPSFAIGVLAVPAAACRRSGTTSSATTSAPRSRTIGLYIAFILPVFLRLRARRQRSSTARGASAGTTSGSTGSRSSGSPSSRPLHAPALLRRACRGRRTSPGSLTNYAILWFIGDRSSSSAAGGSLSAQQLVQGPGADGHRGGARAARGAAGRRVRASGRHGVRVALVATAPA